MKKTITIIFSFFLLCSSCVRQNSHSEEANESFKVNPELQVLTMSKYWSLGCDICYSNPLDLWMEPKVKEIKEFKLLYNEQKDTSIYRFNTKGQLTYWKYRTHCSFSDSLGYLTERIIYYDSTGNVDRIDRICNCYKGSDQHNEDTITTLYHYNQIGLIDTINDQFSVKLNDSTDSLISRTKFYYFEFGQNHSLVEIRESRWFEFHIPADLDTTGIFDGYISFSPNVTNQNQVVFNFKNIKNHNFHYEVNFNSFNDNISYTSDAEWNISGKLIKTYPNPVDTLTFKDELNTQRISYETDDNYNWIKKTETRNHEINQIYIRDITYYKTTPNKG